MNESHLPDETSNPSSDAIEPAPRSGNLFADLPATGSCEAFEDLLRGDAVRIERIVSRGHASPEVGWYEADRGEWVMVASGRARLRFADERAPRELAAGDWLYIAPNRRHRVEATDPDAPTVWLAVHFDL